MTKHLLLLLLSLFYLFNAGCALDDIPLLELGALQTFENPRLDRAYRYGFSSGSWQFSDGPAGGVAGSGVAVGNMDPAYSFACAVPTNGQFAFLQSMGNMTSRAPVDSSYEYTLTWLHAGRVNVGTVDGKQTYAVTVVQYGAVIISQIFSTESSSLWTQQNIKFYSGFNDILYRLDASGSDLFITFAGNTTTDSTAYIDNILLSCQNCPNSQATSTSTITSGRITPTIFTTSTIPTTPTIPTTTTSPTICTNGTASNVAGVTSSKRSIPIWGVVLITLACVGVLQAVVFAAYISCKKHRETSKNKAQVFGAAIEKQEDEKKIQSVNPAGQV